MTKPYIYLGLAALIVVVLLVVIKMKKESFETTLGKYGLPGPNTCFENTSVNSQCRACSSECTDQTNCYTCNNRMMCMQRDPEIRQIPDTAGKPYLACNACHMSCNNPDNCFACKQKMNLAGVL
jgi:hypothetical protein